MPDNASAPFLLSHEDTAMTRHQANFTLLLAGALWGMGFVAQSSAMSAIGPLLFIGSRFLIAFLLILPFALRESAKAEKQLSPRDWRAFGLIGFLMFAGMTAQQIGLLTTTVTNSGFLTGLYVVLVPFVGVILYRQWPAPIVWPSTFCALAGIWLLSGGNAVEGLSTGDWLTILCACIWALQVFLISRSASHTGRPITLAVTQFGITGFIALALAFLLEPISFDALRMAGLEILYAGIFSGGIAFTLQVIGQRHTSAPQAALLLSTEAIFAAIFGAIFLGDRLPPTGLIGCALIFVAILLVEVVPALRNRQVAS